MNHLKSSKLKEIQANYLNAKINGSTVAPNKANTRITSRLRGQVMPMALGSSSLNADATIEKQKLI